MGRTNDRRFFHPLFAPIRAVLHRMGNDLPNHRHALLVRVSVMISHQSMIHLTTIRRGSLATRLPNLFARTNAALIAEMLKKGGDNVRR